MWIPSSCGRCRRRSPRAVSRERGEGKPEASRIVKAADAQIATGIVGMTGAAASVVAPRGAIQIHVLNVFLAGGLKGAVIQATAAFLSGSSVQRFGCARSRCGPGSCCMAWKMPGPIGLRQGPRPRPTAAPTAMGDYGGTVMSIPLFLLGLFFLRHAGRDYGARPITTTRAPPR
jgi:hypothetical protein